MATPKLDALNAKAAAAYAEWAAKYAPDAKFTPYVVMAQAGYSGRSGGKLHLGTLTLPGFATCGCSFRNNGRPLRGTPVEDADLDAVTCKRCIAHIEKYLAPEAK